MGKKIGIFLITIVFLCILYFSYKIYFVNILNVSQKNQVSVVNTGVTQGEVLDKQENLIESTGSTGGVPLNFKYTSTGEIGGGNTY